ncbi:MAG: HAD-IIB family hydrolase [Clostridia bacterium]|nr:HAD-IIB family hydrolase [Clostridia bacterium]
MHILATDFDGTLSRWHGVEQIDLDAIARFRAAGNLFGVVTGRAGDMYDMLVRDNIPFDFVIVMNGAMSIDTDGNTVFEETADGACIRGITELLGKEEYNNFLSCVIHKTRKTFHHGYPDGDEKENYLPLSEIDGIPRFTQLNTWVRKDEIATRATAEINEKYGEYVNALQNGSCIDIPPRGIDKGVGVARYADQMGVPHENVWCAGDNMNDMAMIVRFHGCAVSNARAEIKEAAEATYDGIHAIIDHILEVQAAE